MVNNCDLPLTIFYDGDVFEIQKIKDELRLKIQNKRTRQIKRFHRQGA